MWAPLYICIGEITAHNFPISQRVVICFCVSGTCLILEVTLSFSGCRRPPVFSVALVPKCRQMSTAFMHPGAPSSSCEFFIWCLVNSCYHILIFRTGVGKLLGFRLWGPLLFSSDHVRSNTYSLPSVICTVSSKYVFKISEYIPYALCGTYLLHRVGHTYVMLQVTRAEL